MSHGSKLYKNARIRYRPQDLKLINVVWMEMTGNEFKPDSKVPLDDLVFLEIGDESLVKTAIDYVKEEQRKIGCEFKAAYMTRDGRFLEIPKSLKPLFLLALAKNDCKYSIDNLCMYTPPSISKVN